MAIMSSDSLNSPCRVSRHCCAWAYFQTTAWHSELSHFWTLGHASSCQRHSTRPGECIFWVGRLRSSISQPNASAVLACLNRSLHVDISQSPHPSPMGAFCSFTCRQGAYGHHSSRQALPAIGMQSAESLESHRQLGHLADHESDHDQGLQRSCEHASGRHRVCCCW